MNVVKEHFDSIHQLLAVLEERPNNSEMSDRHESTGNGKAFTGTKNWEEAVNLFENGYTEVLDKIKDGILKNFNATRIENRRHVRTGVVGYVPHVPNAILNLPNSMIYTEQQTQKVKAISIYYAPTDNCETSTQTFINSGIAMLSAINSLEKSGIRVNLNIVFFNGSNSMGTEYTFATVKVKDYREHIDILKLCFPVVHPSLFRRFGFKWLETSPDIKRNGWSSAYGHKSNKLNNFLKKELMNENEFFFSLQDIVELKCDMENILKTIK